MDDLTLSIGPPAPPQVQTEPGAEWGDELGPELAELDAAPPVAGDAVRSLLIALGAGANVLLADRDYAPDLWKFTPTELDALTPPLTRIINARPVLREAMARGDYLAVAITMAGYVGRNAGEVSRANRQKDADADELDSQAFPGVVLSGTDAAHVHGQPDRGDGGGLPHSPVG